MDGRIRSYGRSSALNPSETATKLASDGVGNGLLAHGSAVPSDATAGYATGCIFLHTDGTDNTAAYVNEGTSSSCDFNPVHVQAAGAALTAALTTLTHTAPGTPDYAIQNLTAGGFGFVTADEGNTVLSVLVRTVTRVGEIESRLQAAGIIS